MRKWIMLSNVDPNGCHFLPIIYIQFGANLALSLDILKENW